MRWSRALENEQPEAIDVDIVHQMQLALQNADQSHDKHL